ncbi:receptor-like protein 2 [Cornus florida]|uniref:receptor-like protein 2 n=1 Tax=Cornus florida TaxID=4283 RepID=UPI00289F3455|nr:receptor-like protein 2 [Cornus florida]
MLLWLFHSSSPHHNSHHMPSAFGCFCLDVFLTIVILSSFSNPCHGSCNQLDRDSLLSFSLNISPPLNWSSVIDCCVWDGVSCDGNDQVICLTLPFKGLHGLISPSIANISHLSQLNLSHNWLSGSLPAGFFTSLNQLDTIDLSYNRLSGPLPSSDSLPIATHTLDLSSNHFNGTIQSSFLQPASNLLSFNISNNSFTGTIPSSICSIFPSVQLLDFSSNDFSGEFPQGIGNCSELQVFRAGFNHLAGLLPDDIYSTVQLRELSLPANKLCGSIDDRIVNLTNLAILELFGNEFTGMIPQDIGKLSKLERLLLHFNHLNGTVPPSLMNCVNLTTLNLRVNSFEGELSTLDFSKLLQLNTIDLGNNNFTGSLPGSLFLCKSLSAIRLAGNRLEGQISPDMLALQSLSFLSISNNSLTNFTGAIKILMGCKNLSTVILSKNFFGEAMPDDESIVALGGFQNLQLLSLGGCRFTGQIPAWLAKLKKLEVVDLSQNQFTGSIPSWLGTLPNLFYLDLSSNSLWGNFPKELTELPSLASQEGGDQVDRSYLELPVFIQPDNASDMQYNQLSNVPPAIYLGSNNLNGTIPGEIGRLKFIHVLDLSNNNFCGNIPDQISHLTNLEKLDLSGNHLSGEIPASLNNLNFLSALSVANNNLQGPIPSGVQFDTFSSSSFDGNPGLCGSVLHRPCSVQPGSSHPLHPPAPEGSREHKIIFGLSFGTSFGISLSVTVVTLGMLSRRKISGNCFFQF